MVVSKKTSKDQQYMLRLITDGYLSLIFKELPNTDLNPSKISTKTHVFKKKIWLFVEILPLKKKDWFWIDGGVWNLGVCTRTNLINS
jgi:hypothetical protein